MIRGLCEEQHCVELSLVCCVAACEALLGRLELSCGRERPRLASVILSPRVSVYQEKQALRLRAPLRSFRHFTRNSSAFPGAPTCSACSGCTAFGRGRTARGASLSVQADERAEECRLDALDALQQRHARKHQLRILASSHPRRPAGTAGIRRRTCPHASRRCGRALLQAGSQHSPARARAPAPATPSTASGPRASLPEGRS
jgi:hypothetical protein